MFPWNDILGNTSLQTSEKVFRMGFYDQLYIPVMAVFPGLNNVNQNIGQSRLGAGVQVNLRLFHDDDRTGRRVITCYQNGQYLGDTESNIGKIHPCVGIFDLYFDFIFVALFMETLHFKVINQTHIIETAGNNRFKKLRCRGSRLVCLLYANFPLLGSQQCRYGIFPCISYTIRLDAVPRI